MRIEYLYIAATALAWGGYPLISRAAAYGGARGALMLTLGSLVPIAIGVFVTPESGWPSRSALSLLLTSGVMMGCGLIAFQSLASSPMEVSVSIPIVDVSMLLVTAIGGVLFFSEPATLQKLVGVVLLVAGIALLRPA